MKTMKEREIKGIYALVTGCFPDIPAGSHPASFG